MKKDKYKIVNMVEHELNHAYAEGYEFLCYFNDYYETSNSHTNQSNYNNYNGQPSTIVINLPEHHHQANQQNKVLMQLKSTAEVLYGNQRTNNE